MTHFATNGSVRLAYRIDGSPDRRPLLLINGLGSPLVAFEAGFVSSLVGRGFQVVRFDNRDVGRSSRIEAGGYGLADMAADALAVIDAVGWGQANVVGQSMGGMIAQQLALDAPDRVASLTSVMSRTGEPGYGQATTEAIDALLRPAPTSRDEWLDHRAETERIWASPEHWDESWVRDKGSAMYDYGVDPEGASRQFRAVAASPSRDTDLAGLSVPTLVIHGAADTLIAPDGGRHTAAVIPDARYAEMAGMGHDLPPALWERIIDEVTVFVEGLAMDLR